MVRLINSQVKNKSTLYKGPIKRFQAVKVIMSSDFKPSLLMNSSKLSSSSMFLKPRSQTMHSMFVQISHVRVSINLQGHCLEIPPKQFAPGEKQDIKLSNRSSAEMAMNLVCSLFLFAKWTRVLFLPNVLHFYANNVQNIA